MSTFRSSDHSLRTSAPDHLVLRKYELFLGDHGVSAVAKATGSGEYFENTLKGLWLELWPNTLVLKPGKVGRGLWHWTYAYKTRDEAVKAMRGRGQVGPFVRRK